MAVNNPPISGYKEFYISADIYLTTAKGTLADYNLIAKSNPYPILPKPKAPYKNDWLDENGDDEYLAHLYYEAFEFDVQFYIRANGSTPEVDIRSAINAFFTGILNTGALRFYDSYTGVGYTKVRYAGFKEDLFQVTGSGNNQTARCIFTITFKVNDPVTRTTIETVSNVKRITTL